MIADLREGVRGGDIEGRVALFSAFLLSFSVYLSKMSTEVCLAVIAISALVTRGKALKLMKAFIPFYLLFAVTALFADVLKPFMAFLAIISAGSIVFSSNPAEISAAMLFFKFPKKLVSILQLSISILPLIASDFENARFIHGKSYLKMLKAFVSASILRAISIAESLYSKNYSYIPIFRTKNPRKLDAALIVLSLAISLYSLRYVS